MRKIKQKIIILSLFLLLLDLVNLWGEENYLFFSIDATLMASDPNELTRSLGAWVQEEGGYFTHMSTDQVVLRFPWKKAAEFQSYLKAAGDEVYSYSSRAVDLRENILTSKSGIEARNEILTRNLDLMDKADFQGTLFLEKEILRLMNEIEELKGRLRKEENDVKMARGVIQINFQSHSLPNYIPSSFDWINTLDFSDFLTGDFTGRIGFSRYHLDTPQGFALVDNRTFFRAISPEGIRFQIRKEKNYPVKDLDFWFPTYIRQMEERGYQKKDDGNTFQTAKGVEGHGVEWALSFGNKDYLYLTAIIPYRKNIYIVEAAGEYALYREYSSALLTALESFSPR